MGGPAPRPKRLLPAKVISEPARGSRVTIFAGGDTPGPPYGKNARIAGVRGDVHHHGIGLVGMAAKSRGQPLGRRGKIRPVERTGNSFEGRARAMGRKGNYVAWKCWAPPGPQKGLLWPDFSIPRAPNTRWEGFSNFLARGGGGGGAVTCTEAFLGAGAGKHSREAGFIWDRHQKSPQCGGLGGEVGKRNFGRQIAQGGTGRDGQHNAGQIRIIPGRGVF